MSKLLEKKKVVEVEVEAFWKKVVLLSLSAVMYNKTAYTHYDTGKPVPE